MTEYALRLENSTDTAPRVRAGDAFHVLGTTAVRGRGGLRPDGGGVVSIVAGTMDAQVTAFSCWVDATPTGQVGYPFVCDATKTLTLSPGHATLVRVDTIAVVVRENAFDGSGATTATLEVVEGTPGAGAPAMPAAAIPLRDVNVPAGASVGTGGLTSGDLGSDRRVYTVASGGVLPVASATERDAVGAKEGQVVYRTDLDRLEAYTGAAWTTVWDGAAWTAWTPTIGSTGTAPSLGAGTATGGYQIHGKTFRYWFRVQFGAGASAGTGYYYVSMPAGLTFKNQALGDPAGTFNLVDASGLQVRGWNGCFVAAGQIAAFDASASRFGVAGPFTVASGDAWSGAGQIELA